MSKNVKVTKQLIYPKQLQKDDFTFAYKIIFWILSKDSDTEHYCDVRVDHVVPTKSEAFDLIMKLEKQLFEQKMLYYEELKQKALSKEIDPSSF